MPYTMEDFRREYVKEHLMDLTPAERLEGLSLDERMQGLSPEEIEKCLFKRLEGLSLTTIESYLQRIKQEPTSRKRKKKG